MDGDPRISKPRLPKAYTDDQLAFLRSHIAGFETRTRGHVRGDAKKFALDRAADFLVRFGLPPDLQGIDEAEPRFREQIYNWYKNTVGRARRKQEGRTRAKKLSDKAPSPSGGITWSPPLAPSFSPAPDEPGPSTHHPPVPPPPPPPPPPQQQQLQFTFQTAVSVSSPSTLAMNVTPAALRDAFATHALDAATLSSLVQSFVLAHPSPTPLSPVVLALFDAASALLAAPPASAPPPPATSDPRPDVLFSLLRRFVDACAFFPTTIVHADVSGPLAGPRALLSALRKSAVWVPATPPATHGSLNDEMERIKADRQRRKDFVQWAQIHAAAIELGIVGRSSATVVASVNGAGSAYHLRPAQDLAYAAPAPPSPPAPSPVFETLTFSEMMVRDAVWEPDEVEWVAGIIVLRAIIRTTVVERKRQWEQLLAAYERRWKEIKDEARQALVTEVLLVARDELARLEDDCAT